MDTKSIRTELLEILAEQKFPHGCIVPMPDGAEEEVTEAVPCRRCAQLGSAGASR